VWWITAGRIHGVRSDEPRDRVITPTGPATTWLGYDAPREALLWVAGGTLQAMPESGGAVGRWRGCTGSCAAAFATSDDATFGSSPTR